MTEVVVCGEVLCDATIANSGVNSGMHGDVGAGRGERQRNDSIPFKVLEGQERNGQQHTTCNHTYLYKYMHIK